MNGPHIYVIAGEASGDFLGAQLMRALKEKDQNLRFSGIGGAQMEAEGLRSLFPMEAIALMGFAEILPHIFRLKKLIKQTINDIFTKRPDIIITIDSPGFNFRVIRALQDFPAKKIHYVAPTVWAYKPERAKKTAALFDHLLVLLPFEPPYFEAEGLRTSFIGHPAVRERKERQGGEHFRAAHHIPEEALLLGMMPGSRKGELARHLPVFREVAARLIPHFPNLHLLIPTPSHLIPILEAETRHWPLPVVLTSKAEEKMDAFSACDLALVKSGTVALEVAVAGVPMITTYRAHPISYYIIKRLAKVRYVNLINLILDKPLIPEYIQQDCTAEKLTAALEALLSDPAARAAQVAATRPALLALGLEQPQTPSSLAAEVVLNLR